MATTFFNGEDASIRYLAALAMIGLTRIGNDKLFGGIENDGLMAATATTVSTARMQRLAERRRRRRMARWRHWQRTLLAAWNDGLAAATVTIICGRGCHDTLTGGAGQ